MFRKVLTFPTRPSAAARAAEALPPADYETALTAAHLMMQLSRADQARVLALIGHLLEKLAIVVIVCRAS